MERRKQGMLFEMPGIISPAASFSGPESLRLERKYASRMEEELSLGNLVSYVGNKSIPFLRLYQYKEAFAFRFVEEWIARFGLGTQDSLLDPFCGMGTTLFAASCRGIAAIGVDRLPIATFSKEGLLQAAIEVKGRDRLCRCLGTHRSGDEEF